jgi:two-component system cell cycle sensor histidine kinase/response regulator CckA
VRKGSEFIDSLLKFSRRGTGTETEMVALNLNEVLEETYMIISNTFDINIRISTNIEESLPIKGDFSSLSQAFMNICNNARDAMPEGGELTIEATKKKDKVVVIISDTGCGIGEEALKNIFDPFYTTKEVGAGTGLGLSITHGIIEEHHGKILASSQPGKGTAFRLVFPIAEEYDRIESKSPLSIRRGKGERVLIVDDEPKVLKGLETMLKSIGYEVDAVSSGSKAIEHYKTSPPDLVLLDWKMPQMDGATCAKKILEHDQNARIVVISGYQEVNKEIIGAEIQKAIKNYVLKPCDLKKLSSIVARALRS